MLALLPGLAPASGAGAAVLHRRDAADRSDPVAAAQRSAAAAAKASRRRLADGTPAHSFRTLLEHLASLTRNQVHLLQQPYPVTTELLATPTPLQRRAFDLVGAPIPLILT
jgi:hypothetical protein